MISPYLDRASSPTVSFMILASMNSISNEKNSLNNMRQIAATLDQQAVPFITAGRLLEGYGRLTHDALAYATSLEKELATGKNGKNEKGLQ